MNLRLQDAPETQALLELSIVENDFFEALLEMSIFEDALSKLREFSKMLFRSFAQKCLAVPRTSGNQRNSAQLSGNQLRTSRVFMNRSFEVISCTLLTLHPSPLITSLVEHDLLRHKLS